MSTLLSTHSRTPVDVPAEADTLVALLRQAAVSRPERVAYTFLSDDEGEPFSLSYGELDRRARATAAWLRRHVEPGGRVLLLYPHGPEYVASFFGCLYAGVVAVPAYPPRRNRNLLRLRSVVEDCGAAAALTTGQILSRVAAMAADAAAAGASLRWLTSDEVEEGMEEEWREPSIGEDSIAFLQYTSGSTSTPKGVVLTHGNLLHNERLIRQSFRQSEESVIVGWLPLYHDMGLIGNVIQPLYAGATCVLMSPVSFLQRPLRWLRAISQYKATTSGGPNFAYDLCVRKVTGEERAALDLSSWAVAFNGAEPIRAETLERFAEAFAPCGFRREAFFPCYGLAEATLMVSGRTKPEPPVVKTLAAEALEEHRVSDAPAGGANGRAVVGCGSALPEQRVVIADPHSLTVCGPNRVGEIWVSGPSVARGYWNRAEETERVFRAHLSDTDEGPYLRTGDLGFIDGGELYVTGRLKDLIIIRGRNHYPQDIELTAERSHASLRAGCGAAFSAPVGGEERLLVVYEVEHRCRDFDAVVRSVSEAVAQEHEVQPAAVVLLRPGGVPKTSSGKIQRHACRKAFLDGGFDALASWREAGAGAEEPAMLSSESARAIEDWLRSRLASRLGVDIETVDAAGTLTQYGLDSLHAIELMHGIETGLGVTLPPATLLREVSIAGLAAELFDLASKADAAARDEAAHAESSAEQPLSFGQQSLWFIHQMAPQSAAYNLVGAVRICSGLDVAALRQSFRKLVERHAALRTSFAARDGEPFQRVHEHAEFDIHVEDASAWGDEELSGRLSEAGHRPFDLGRAPLLRVQLFSRSPTEHFLLLALHHIVADFWSLAVLVNELGELYDAAVRGSRPRLPPLATSYTDFVRRQKAMTSGAEGERLWGYWRERLKGELPKLELPADRPRLPAQTYRGASVFFKVGEETVGALTRLGRRQGATLYVTLLAAFQTLLARYTNQREVVVGSPVSGRSRAEVAGLVGYFVNPVVLRADFSGDPTFIELLEQVRQSALGAFDHQDYPFPLLVEKLQPARDPSRSPLFQAMFVLQKGHLPQTDGLASFALGEGGARVSLAGLELESVALEQRVAQFDLTLMMAQTGGGLSASFNYNADLFDATTVARMCENFQTLLAGLAASPGQRLSRLPLLSDGERRRLLREWNDTAHSFPRGECLHTLFSRQARLTPEATALVSGAGSLTYSELDGLSDALAGRLRRLGVGPESVVAVLMRRSPELVVSLLGVLKAGGAYLPLDPEYPRERLAFMLEDASPLVLLADEGCADAAPEWEGERLIVGPSPWGRPGAGELEEERVKASVAPDNVAYVIYTSGSTGRPKGVAIAHSSACLLARWAHALFGPDRLRSVLFSTSVCFDLSVFELFAPLSCGGRVAQAQGVLRQHDAAAAEVTLVNTVPSAMAELLRGGGLPAGVRVVNLAGEPLAAELAAAAYGQAGVEWVVNLYGPTEDTTYSTFEVVERGGRVSIGRPIAGTRAYVLDSGMSLVPAGAAGELYLGGEGLARGYLRRPGLTAERFVPDPFSGQTGARLYRTGDVVRHLGDGRLDYLGRADNQVKVRGFRIELGEVESALRGAAGVREAVALARDDRHGAKRLVAYFVPEAGQRPTAGALRAHLQESLPLYMIPSAFVAMDAFPLTPNGKVDKRALPAPGDAGADSESDYVAPRNPAEETLADIWRQVLGVERVGVNDNFFELGGDSILSLQIISRASQVGLRLDPQQLFQCQTVAQLAEVAGESPALKAEQVVAAGDFPLTPIQRWFFEGDDTDRGHFNQSLMLEVRGALAAGVLRRAVEHLLARHDALRMRFRHEAGGWRQSYAASETHEVFSEVDLSALARGAQAAAVADACESAQRSLDLEEGPLMRGVLFRLGASGPDRLLLVIHHLVVDGVSWRILVEDLQQCCAQLMRGEEPDLGPKTSSFRQWAEGLKRHVEAAGFGDEAGYWADAGSRHAPRIKTDGPGVNTVASARTVRVELDADETRSLLQELPQNSNTQIQEVLLTALARAFGRWDGRRALLLDVEGHGRAGDLADVNLSRTVGWFTALYPVLLETDADATPGAALGLVKERLRRVPRGGLGYGLLRYSGGAEDARRLAALPAAEVSFNYLGHVDQVLRDSEWFALAEEGAWLSRSPRSLRRHLIEIDGGVVAGRLALGFAYSENVHRRQTVERLAGEFVAALRELIAHCRQTQAGGSTPSDFPLARLNQAKLDKLASLLNK